MDSFGAGAYPAEHGFALKAGANWLAQRTQ
jgi:hypothetical protein